MSSVKQHIELYSEGVLNSYAQVFFSKNKVFAIILFIASFIDINAGLSGLLSILLAQLLATAFSYNKELVRDGTYTYNCLMVGLGIGVYYQFNFSFAVLLVFSVILTFFLTVWLASNFSKDNLPFLSIPFLLGLWIILLGADNFSALQLTDRGIYTVAQPEVLRFNVIGQLNKWVEGVPLPNLLILYFKSLGAIFFQFNILAGLLISIGLIYFSRIAFTLSFLGFFIGYLFYSFFEGDFTQLIYSYIGFNFILTAIALGGFFIVPSWRSYLMLIIIIPLIAILISALHTIFTAIGLPLYSLPFNIVVLLLLVTLKLRLKPGGLELVSNQQFSPETNHYKHHNSVERFQSETLIHIHLPIMGKWNVSQGHEGNVTHKGDWEEAWDFDVRDEYGKTFKMPGGKVEDYYCYNLPVLSPAPGWVVKIIDGIPDNKIHEMDIDNNWGNSIIIKHSDYLYSNLSHLKKDSFKVKVGDYVEQGDTLANCGSSGRSPEPHLHFQLQEKPYVGSKTLKYPISYYIVEEEAGVKLHSFDIPKQGALVSNIATTPLLKEAFNFVPGRVMEFEVEGMKTDKVKWEVFTDALNYTYIYCHNTKSYAYFSKNKTIFYFTDFNGDTGSLLHHFYIGAQRLLLGYYDNVKLTDKLLIEGFFNKPAQVVQDIVAPFFHFMTADYECKFLSRDDEHKPKEIVIKSKAEAYLMGNNTKTINFEFVLKHNRIDSFTIIDNSKTIKAKCIS